MPELPPIGSSDFLKGLDPLVPDEFVAALLPRHRGRGRHTDLASFQLFRALLLTVLAPVTSFNRLCRLLPQNRAWRQFLRLHRYQVPPGPRTLHEFRQRLPPAVLRSINAHLLTPLLDGVTTTKTVALIDATDLPAATSAYKKKFRPVLRRPRLAWWPQPEVGPVPLVRGLQKAHPATMAAAGCRPGGPRTAGLLGRTRSPR